MRRTVKEIDVAIIGAGPIGIELAVALKEAGVSFLQFDKGQIAQMIFQYPPETRFFSSSDKIGIAGIPIQTVDQQKCSREQYLAYLRSVVLKYQLPIHTHAEVQSIEKGSDGKYLLTIDSCRGQEVYRVKYVVLATGGLGSHRKLGVEGENLPHVSTSLCDPHQYFQKHVVIIGGKNSAVEAALRCFHAAANVSLVIRKSEFDDSDVKYWLLPELKSRVKKGEMKCYFGSTVKAIYPDRVHIRENGANTETAIQADFVIKAIGFEADDTLFKQLGVSCDESTGSPAYCPETMETSCDNVFLVGTAIAGTQKRFRVYIENTHHHVAKICKVLCHRLQLKAPSSEWLEKLPEPDTILKKFLEE